MRAKQVYEFTRGNDPLSTLGIGSYYTRIVYPLYIKILDILNNSHSSGYYKMQIIFDIIRHSVSNNTDFDKDIKNYISYIEEIEDIAWEWREDTFSENDREYCSRIEEVIKNKLKM